MPNIKKISFAFGLAGLLLLGGCSDKSTEAPVSTPIPKPAPDPVSPSPDILQTDDPAAELEPTSDPSIQTNRIPANLPPPDQTVAEEEVEADTASDIVRTEETEDEEEESEIEEEIEVERSAPRERSVTVFGKPSAEATSTSEVVEVEISPNTNLQLKSCKEQNLEPRKYEDGRISIPLVVEFNRPGPFGPVDGLFFRIFGLDGSDRFFINSVRDTGDGGDAPNWVTVFKGPNYCAGDKVIIYSETDFRNKVVTLDPRTLGEQASYSFSYDTYDGIGSLKIVKTKNCRCADPEQSSDFEKRFFPRRWADSIPLVLKLYNDTGFEGDDFIHIVGNVLDTWQMGFNDTASSAKVFKGPHYQEGDVFRVYVDKNYGGDYKNLTPAHKKYRDFEIYDFNDTISSVKLIKGR